MNRPSKRSATVARRKGTALGGLAFSLGAVAAVFTPSSTGCLFPDTCILVTSSGDDWCRLLIGAQMWPIGQPEDAVDVKAPEGGPPLGCACFNSAENEVLDDGLPADYAATLAATLEQAARDACDAVVPAGYDHNCYLDGPGDPQVESSYRLGLGKCVGDCAYTDDCGDPDPYECENIVDGRSGESSGGGGETGGEGGDINPGAYINCAGNICDIDEGFAVMLWSAPSLLLSESTRLVYEPGGERFEFASISVDTLAAELGFRDGDLLESVNGVIIDDLDAALEVYASNSTARSLRVRVARGERWIDFTFNVVR